MAQKKSHKFQNKLILNQWLLSLFGIDPFREHEVNGSKRRPFHLLKAVLTQPSGQQREGLDHENVHHFYHDLIDSELFYEDRASLKKADLLRYEEHIVRHTQTINEKRERKIEWKYFQWLCLLFAEVYLDRYFRDRDALLDELNEFIDRFNAHWDAYDDVDPYEEDDLNKVCFQMATGSGKTLVMHVNLLQFQHYAAEFGADSELSRGILITPNERLSRQHIEEMTTSDLRSTHFAEEGFSLFTQAKGLDRVDVIEIHKLGDEEKKNTIETRSLGDQNLLLVDEGHRGLGGSSGSDELGTWMSRRQQLAANGFTFEYSATFGQAVAAANNSEIEEGYAKSILFDYGYRWFYEDGYGKDYKIDNLPKPDEKALERVRKHGNYKKLDKLSTQAEVGKELQPAFLTAALLKFYQQLRIYDDKFAEGLGAGAKFNIEKPLWVFVGSSVTSGYGKSNRMSDVANILRFFADFLGEQDRFTRHIESLITETAEETGLVDENGHDIFANGFTYLRRQLDAGATAKDLYSDILDRLFNNRAGGSLRLERLTGDSGEVVLRTGNADEPFGLINVGDAKGLCDHIDDETEHEDNLHITKSDFSEGIFDEVSKSSSPINLLLGSRKFTEGWDCWRVSSLGLMNIGKSEGAQIIQLFGRGVRLKGYEWSLKRSGHADTGANEVPDFIEELETLNVFGIEASYMERFQEVLSDEGLPGNEQRQKIRIPLNVTYDFGKKLQILRPKKKKSDGSRYSFKKDGPVPNVGEVPEYLEKNQVVVDYYPKIQAIDSTGRDEEIEKDKVSLGPEQLTLIDYDKLFFELEQFKAERSWYNFNITKEGVRRVLGNPNWYELYLPENKLQPDSFDDVRHLRRIALEMMKRYCERLYKYKKRAFTEPRLEYQELSPNDGNIPDEEEQNYTITVDGDETELIDQLDALADQIDSGKRPLTPVRNLDVCNFSDHLFQPLLHVSRGSKLTVRPVALNDSEFEFVTELKDWCENNAGRLDDKDAEIYLLRNLSRGKGIGFFEAGNFHPDFILWVLRGDQQYVTFVDPHGLQHTGQGDPRIEFAETIKDVEQRLDNPDIVLNSFILSPTEKVKLNWGMDRSELEEKNVLFMKDPRYNYVEKLFDAIGALGNDQTEPTPMGV